MTENNTNEHSKREPAPYVVVRVSPEVHADLLHLQVQRKIAEKRNVNLGEIIRDGLAALATAQPSAPKMADRMELVTDRVVEASAKTAAA